VAWLVISSVISKLKNFSRSDRQTQSRTP